MAIVEVAILYAACGVGCAAAILARKPRRVADAVLLVPLWPLFGPFIFLSTPSRPGDLSGLLPTADAVAPLKQRLEIARQRLTEIDDLLARPSFDLAALDVRLAALGALGSSSRALASARSRRRSIERLATRRKVLATELEELAELFLQLETQTEVVRLAGSADDSVGDLIADIQARLESIDEIEAEASTLS